jgi:hypothetical protein
LHVYKVEERRRWRSAGERRVLGREGKKKKKEEVRKRKEERQARRGPQSS